MRLKFKSFSLIIVVFLLSIQDLKAQTSLIDTIFNLELASDFNNGYFRPLDILNNQNEIYCFYSFAPLGNINKEQLIIDKVNKTQGYFKNRYSIELKDSLNYQIYTKIIEKDGSFFISGGMTIGEPVFKTFAPCIYRLDTLTGESFFKRWASIPNSTGFGLDIFTSNNKIYLVNGFLGTNNKYEKDNGYEIIRVYEMNPNLSIADSIELRIPGEWLVYKESKSNQSETKLFFNSINKTTSETKFCINILGDTTIKKINKYQGCKNPLKLGPKNLYFSENGSDYFLTAPIITKDTLYSFILNKANDTLFNSQKCKEEILSAVFQEYAISVTDRFYENYALVVFSDTTWSLENNALNIMPLNDPTNLQLFNVDPQVNYKFSDLISELNYIEFNNEEFLICLIEVETDFGWKKGLLIYNLSNNKSFLIEAENDNLLQLKIIDSDIYVYSFRNNLEVLKLKLGDKITNVSENEINKTAFFSFPNPTTSQINFTSTPEQVWVYSNNGKLVYQSQKPNPTINVNLPNGLYFLQAQFEDGLKSQKLIIRNP